jgi:hypothetical protein
MLLFLPAFLLLFLRAVNARSLVSATANLLSDDPKMGTGGRRLGSPFLHYLTFGRNSPPPSLVEGSRIVPTRRIHHRSGSTEEESGLLDTQPQLRREHLFHHVAINGSSEPATKGMSSSNSSMVDLTDYRLYLFILIALFDIAVLIVIIYLFLASRCCREGLEDWSGLPRREASIGVASPQNFFLATPRSARSESHASTIFL